MWAVNRKKIRDLKKIAQVIINDSIKKEKKSLKYQLIKEWQSKMHRSRLLLNF